MGPTKWMIRRHPNGCKLRKIVVQNSVHGNFHVKFKLKNKMDNFKWVLIAVYGAAQDEGKESFLRESTFTCRRRLQHN
jgi:hypothetical protein